MWYICISRCESYVKCCFYCMYFYVEKKGQWVTCNKLIYTILATSHGRHHTCLTHCLVQQQRKHPVCCESITDEFRLNHSNIRLMWNEFLYHGVILTYHLLCVSAPTTPNCSQPDAVDFVRTLCEGREECDVPVHVWSFMDPSICQGGFTKFMKVLYSCQRKFQ